MNLAGTKVAFGDVVVLLLRTFARARQLPMLDKGLR